MVARREPPGSAAERVAEVAAPAGEPAPSSAIASTAVAEVAAIAARGFPLDPFPFPIPTREATYPILPMRRSRPASASSPGRLPKTDGPRYQPGSNRYRSHVDPLMLR